MPKKKKARKNAKNNKGGVTMRKLELADEEGQIYGQVVKVLGGRYFTVRCLDNKERRCKARSRRLRTSLEDMVIVSLRDFDDKNADILHVYKDYEVRTLRERGYLPKEGGGDEDDEDVSVCFQEEFDFDQI